MDSVDDGVGLVDGVVAVQAAAVRHGGAPVDVVLPLFCHQFLFLNTFFFFTLSLLSFIFIIAFVAIIDRATPIPAAKCHVDTIFNEVSVSASLLAFIMITELLNH